MTPRGFDPEMIVNLRDVVERNFSTLHVQVEASLANQTNKVVAHFETSSCNQDKDRMR